MTELALRWAPAAADRTGASGDDGVCLRVDLL